MMDKEVREVIIMDEVTITESVYSDWLEMVTSGEYRNWEANEHPRGLNKFINC